MLLELLTKGGLTPFDLGAILLVGGASRQPHFRLGVKDGISSLGGEDYAAQVMVVADGELCEDLNALGAVLM